MSFSYTISNLKADLTASLHGTTLNKLTGVNNMIQRAASDLLLELDPMETKRINQLASPIFNKVYDYALPVDLKGTKIIDIRPQANRTLLDRYVQEYNQTFDIGKAYTLNPNFTIQYNQGIKTIRIDNNLLINGILLNQADTITGNGLWQVADDATNLRQDNLQFINGASSSLEFNLDGSTTSGSIFNSTIPPLDLSEHYLQSQIFFWVYLPTAANFTSFYIFWGQNGLASWYKQITTAADGTAFQNGWNLLQADWATATAIGSPNSASVNYVSVEYVYNGTAMNGCKLNSIYSRLGVISEIEYYSKYLFQDAITGAFQETITDDSNIINLDTESRNLLFLLCGIYMTQQVQGLDAMFYDNNFFQSKYEKALAMYKSQYKSEVQKPRSTYYGMPNPSNKKYFNGNRYSY